MIFLTISFIALKNTYMGKQGNINELFESYGY